MTKKVIHFRHQKRANGRVRQRYDNYYFVEIERERNVTEREKQKEYKMKWKRTKEDEDRYRAAIAQWIRLLRPSWSPRLKSQAFTFIVYCAIFVLDLRKGRNIQKRSALTHI